METMLLHLQVEDPTHAGVTPVIPHGVVLTHVLASAEMGGAERVALELAERQRSQGVDVSVISLAPLGTNALVEEFRDSHIRIEAVAKRPGFDLSLIPRLAARFRQLRTSLVHTHNPQPLVYGAPAARLALAGVIHTKHGVNPDIFRRQWLRRRAASLVHTFVAVSDETAREAVRNEEVAHRKLRVILNGVDPVRFSADPDAALAIRASLAIGPRDAVIGTVGRLCGVKNHALLLRAVAPLLRSGAWLVVVGDGPHREALETLAMQLGVDTRVRWLGERKDVAALLSAMNVFALSSDSEGLPLVILEAMATELPVVATSVGGVPSVVLHGQTGFLVPAADESGLRERLRAVLADGGLARELGRRGRARVLAEFCSDRVVRQYQSLYLDAWRTSTDSSRREVIRPRRDRSVDTLLRNEGGRPSY